MSDPTPKKPAEFETDPGLGSPDDLATRALKILPDGPRPSAPAPSPFTATTPMKVEPGLPEARPEPATGQPSSMRHWVFGLLAVVLLGGTLAYYFYYPSGEAPAALQAQEDVPPVLRPYLDRANQGDPSAMRMLGTMYYNGLNVRQDRKEGVKWYRKAAAAGSVAAKKDLETLGLAPEEHPKN